MLIALLTLASLLTQAAAQTVTDETFRGDASGGGITVVRPRRLITWYNFEERTDTGVLVGLGFPMPPDWFVIGRAPDTADLQFLSHPVHREAVGRPGFPRYTHVGYDRSVARSKPFSLKIQLDGGQAGAFLQLGAVPVMPGSDYLVTLWLKTEKFKHAHVHVESYFIDSRGRVIEPSRSFTNLTGDADWRPVSVRLQGEYPGAAWLGLEVSVLQPAANPDDPLGVQQVVARDLNAAAWIDDVGIWQLPHVEVTPSTPAGIVRAPAKVSLHLNVRDLTGQSLHATVDVYDHQQRLIDRQAQPVGDGSPGEWTWQPHLPRYGWYLVDLKVVDKTVDGVQPVARTATALLYLPPKPSLSTAAVEDLYRFTWSPDVENAAMLPEVIELGRSVDMRSIIHRMFTRDATLKSLDEQMNRMDMLVRAAATRSDRLTLAFAPWPDELLRRPDVYTQASLEILAGDAATWEPYLRPVFQRFGQRVRRWQLSDGVHGMMGSNVDFAKLTAAAKNELQRLTPEPTLVLPWPAAPGSPAPGNSASQSGAPGSRASQNGGRSRVSTSVGSGGSGGSAGARRRGPVPASDPKAPPTDAAGGDAVGDGALLRYRVTLPAGVTPDAMDAFIKSWPMPASEMQLVIEVPGADQMTHERRIDDLVRRMVEAWRLGVGEVVLDRGWTPAETRTPAVIADPLLGVFRQTARQLAGRRVVGEMPLGEGLRCLILDGASGSALVVWNDSATNAVQEAPLYLGSQPEMIDVWGNREPVELRDGRHVLRVGRTPAFIEGIDARLALFRASFSLDDPVLEATQVRHHRRLKLTNPWPVTVSGTFTIVGPEGWEMWPQRQMFSIAAGGSAEYDLDIAFPVSAVSGTRPLTARFEFTADQAYDVKLSTPLHLGLRRLWFKSNLVLVPGRPGQPRNVVVVCIVTNSGASDQSFNIFASLYGQRRQERPISRLEPGQTVIRRFTFPAAERQLREHAIWTGIRETNGPAVLNERLQLP